MRLFLFCLFIAIVTWVLGQITTEFIAALLLGILSIFASLASEKLKNFLGIRTERVPKFKHSPQPDTQPTERTRSLIYLNLVFVLLALIFFLTYYAELITFTVDDLVEKGFLSFDKEQDGYIHIQTYIGGFVFMLPIAITLGIYGFIWGARGHKAEFPALMLSVFIAFLLAIVLLTLIRGEWTGATNYNLLARVNPELIPIGPRYIPEVFALAAGSLILLSFTVYLYISNRVGRGWGILVLWFVKQKGA
ncbi:MAG: hypothetical protein GY797_12315 [Deltaproteobacteria bacterium]|nr:hypothetical protein [Deltaproteobacteria bacterium]